VGTRREPSAGRKYILFDFLKYLQLDISKLRRSYPPTFIDVNRSTYAPNSTYPQFSSITLQLHKYVAFEELPVGQRPIQSMIVIPLLPAKMKEEWLRIVNV